MNYQPPLRNAEGYLFQPGDWDEDITCALANC